MTDALPPIEAPSNENRFMGESSRGGVRGRILTLIDENPDDADALRSCLDEISRETNWEFWWNLHTTLGTTFSVDDLRRVFS